MPWLPPCDTSVTAKHQTGEPTPPNTLQFCQGTAEIRQGSFNLQSSHSGPSQSRDSGGIQNPRGHPLPLPPEDQLSQTLRWGSLDCAEDAPVKRRDLGIWLSPKLDEVHDLEMVVYVVAQGSERSVHIRGIVISLVALEEALTAELFLEKGAVLVKSPLDPGDAASFTHPQFPAHQPDEALIMGHQNHATLKDRRPKALRGPPRSAEAWGGVGSEDTLTLKLLRARPRASIVSISRWFVGSSRM